MKLLKIKSKNGDYGSMASDASFTGECELSSLTPTEKAGSEMCAYNSNTGVAETGGSLGFAGQRV